MFNKISSLILAILLFLVLRGSQVDFTVVVASLGVLIICTFAINIKRLGFSWSHLLLPIFFIVGVGCIFSVLTNPTWRFSFLVFASMLFYFVETHLGRESHFLQNIYLASVFAIYVGLFAVNFYFHVGTLWTVLSSFVLTYVLIAQGFAGFSLPAKKYFTIIISLVIAQATWGLLLWPVFYLNSAVVVFCMFYLLWIFSFSAFFGKLSIKKIYLQASLISVVLLATLLTAAWKPLYN